MRRFTSAIALNQAQNPVRKPEWTGLAGPKTVVTLPPPRTAGYHDGSNENENLKPVASQLFKRMEKNPAD